MATPTFRTDLAEIYSSDFYRAVPHTLSSAQIISAIVYQWIQPKKVVDLGCGRGEWLCAFKKLGAIEIFGIDNPHHNSDTLLIPERSFKGEDLNLTRYIGSHYDLAICLEVLEHVTEPTARHLIHALMRAAPVILFSAAIPGQPGVNHINCRLPQYWHAFFEQYGFQTLDAIRPQILHNPQVAWWYRQNTFLYVHRSHLDRYPILASHALESASDMIILHESIYRTLTTRSTQGKVNEALKKFFRALVPQPMRALVKSLRAYRKRFRERAVFIGKFLPGLWELCCHEWIRLRTKKLASRSTMSSTTGKCVAIYLSRRRDLSNLISSLDSLHRHGGTYVAKTLIFLEDKENLSAQDRSRLSNHPLTPEIIFHARHGAGRGTSFIYKELEAFHRAAQETPSASYFLKVDSDTIFVSERVFGSYLKSSADLFGQAIRDFPGGNGMEHEIQGGCYFLSRHAVEMLCSHSPARDLLNVSARFRIYLNQAFEDRVISAMGHRLGLRIETDRFQLERFDLLDNPRLSSHVLLDELNRSPQVSVVHFEGKAKVNQLVFSELFLNQEKMVANESFK